MKIKKIPNINARDFATILNMNPYQSPFQLLENKVEKRHAFFGNKFTEHGCKYESLALQKYSETTGNIVDKKQKIIKHPQFSWITGRMDGVVKVENKKTSSEEEVKSSEEESFEEHHSEILSYSCGYKGDCDDIENEKQEVNLNQEEDNYEIQTNSKKRKRKSSSKNIVSNKKRKISNELNLDDEHLIVEVKCPLNKEIKELSHTNDIPKHYWSQCQVYMNMLNCDDTHYVEFHIKPDAPDDSGILKYVALKKDEKWWNENLPKIISFYEEVKKYCTLGSLESHPVRIAEKEWIDSL